MIQSSFLSLNNLKINNNIQDNTGISFFQKRTNNAIENGLQNIDEKNTLIPSIDDYESLFNIFFIEELEKSIKSNKKIFNIKKVERPKKKIIGIKNRKSPSVKDNKSNEKKIKIEDILFPFDAPKGNISNNDSRLFITTKYIKKKNGKKKFIPKKRKFKSDDIHKKIKSRFHKELKNIINKNLKKSKSKKFFGFLPQSFISNVSKLFNSNYLNLTYKELLSTDFGKIKIKGGLKASENDHKQYQKNKDVLNYLEKNPEIDKKSGFSIIKEMKYKDLLKKYFKSAQFENSILQLKEEGESYEYISKYILKAKHYIDFFNNYNSGKNDEIITDEK